MKASIAVGCILVFASCSSCTDSPVHPRDANVNATSNSGPDVSVEMDQSSCGTPGAAAHCLSVTWPRLAIAFGDEGAADLAYTFRADDGFTSSDRGPCPSGYSESSMLHCDIAFYANPNEHQVTLEVAGQAGAAPQISKMIALRAFNNCGNGIAQVIVTAGDASGAPQVSEPQYVNACGSL